MEKHQVIFVLRNEQIAQYRYQDGGLAICTKKGLERIPYDPETYWNDWKEENYFSPENDVLDALFLSDSPDLFTSLPEWCFDKTKKTSWNLDSLESLASLWNVPFCVKFAGREQLFGKSQNSCKLILYLRFALKVALAKLCILPLKDRFIISEMKKKGERDNSIRHETEYQQSHLQEKLRQLKKEILDSYNLGESDLAFVLIANEDALLTKATEDALGNALVQTLPLESTLQQYMNDLKGDATLLVDQFGINFDDKSYLLKRNDLEKNDFSLLAYTVNYGDFMGKFIQQKAGQ